MNCWRCGAFILEGAQSCSNCGASLEQTAGDSTPQPEPFTSVSPDQIVAEQVGGIPSAPSVLVSPEGDTPVHVSGIPACDTRDAEFSTQSVAFEPVVSEGHENTSFPHESTGDFTQQTTAPSHEAGFDSAGTPPPSEKTKKKFWRPTTIVATVGLALALGVGGYCAYDAYREYVRSTTYEEALTLMAQEEYPAALEKFSGLEEYRDAYDQAWYCTQEIAYGEAKNLLEAKDYKGAEDAFETLGTFRDALDYVDICVAWQTFEEAAALTKEGKCEDAQKKGESIVKVTKVWDAPEVKEWRKKNDYALADLSFSKGAFYDAYTRFTSLVKKYGEYEDASARAEACVQPIPGSTVLYHNEGFHSSSPVVNFNAGDSQGPRYVKIYSGNTLVATLFSTPAAPTTIHLPAGDYTLKEAVGDKWFGETDMFGKTGFYSVMLFDGGNDVVHLEGGRIYDITLYKAGGGGNVGDKNVKPENF